MVVSLFGVFSEDRWCCCCKKETKEQIKDISLKADELAVRADCANDTQEDLTLKHNITKHGKPYSDYSDIDPFHNNILSLKK